MDYPLDIQNLPDRYATITMGNLLRNGLHYVGYPGNPTGGPNPDSSTGDISFEATIAGCDTKYPHYDSNVNTTTRT